MDIFDWIINNLDKIVIVLTTACTLASAITALTPTPSDDEAVSRIYKWIEKIALVVGKAKE